MITTYHDYKTMYHGTKIGETEWESLEAFAEDALRFITRGRFREDNLPEDAPGLMYAKKAVCAAAEAIKRLNERREQIEKAGGVMKSATSGRESVTYETNGIDAAILNGEQGESGYIYEAVHRHLFLLNDPSGVCYLYWGF